MSNNILWTEKYRPRNIDQLLEQDNIKSYIRGIIRDKTIMNVIFYGCAGTGKTSLAHIIIKNFFTSTNKKRTNNLIYDRVLSINASSDGNISTIRDKIKLFASHDINHVDTLDGIPPIKLVILDEVDHMPHDAQFALRKIMEDFSQYTRFILICNYISKLIEPLISRCAKFHFLPISPPNVKTFIDTIFLSENKNITIPDDIYNYVYTYTKGDMRKIINIFQRISTFNSITVNVSAIQLLLCDFNIDNVIDCVINGSVNNILKSVQHIINNAFDVLKIIDNLFQHFLTNTYNNTIKCKIFSKLSETNYKLTTGCTSKIQLINLFLYINSLFSGYSITEIKHPYTVN